LKIAKGIYEKSCFNKPAGSPLHPPHREIFANVTNGDHILSILFETFGETLASQEKPEK